MTGSDGFDELYDRLTAGLSEGERRMLLRLVAAHMSFLAGLLKTARTATADTA